MKKIIVTGVTGQDGSHMVDYLLKNTNHEIYGSVRRLSVKNHENILHLENEPRFHLIDMDLNDAHSMRDVILDVQARLLYQFCSTIICCWQLELSNSNMGHRCKCRASHS